MKRLITLAVGIGALIAGVVVDAVAQVPLDPLSLTKYVDPLPIPGAMPSAGGNHYEIGMYQVTQQLHSQLPPTTVWGYGTSAATASYPAATIEAQRGVPITVRWTNHLPMNHLLDYAIDTTLHMAHWYHGVPTSVHLHGGEVEPGSDGGPDSWFTQGFMETGPGWTQEVLNYPNQQLPTTLWYHDHVLGLTRLNVYAGLAGFYLLRDPAIDGPLNLPAGQYEIPLVIQDRMFNTDGSLHYPVGGDNPDIHPLWQPEFFGDVIVVNGKVWPYLNVEPRKYRIRLLNGSNARFYSLRMYNDATTLPGPGFWQIGSDGGYLDMPVQHADPADPNGPRLVVAPGERCDLIIDFSGNAPGTTFTLRNNAKSPFPNGDIADPRTVGQIMQFRVIPQAGPDNSDIATPGPGYVTRLTSATATRQLTLDEMMGPNGPIMALLNNTTWEAPASETPTLGATEIWRIINTTGDAHPIHLHLTQFQLLSRQKYNVGKYATAYMDMAGPAPDITPYLVGKPIPAPPEEAGWKDTYKMLPGEVTTVIVRFAPQGGEPAYSFDATAEPGYVWHCHILEHEDNEMMRPLKILPPIPTVAAKAGGAVPEGITLEQNNPNPFNPTTEIAFALPNAAHVDLAIYNLLGRRVRTLVSGGREAGEHRVIWDGRDAAGLSVASGVYLYRLSTGNIVESRKMILLK